MVKEVRKIGGKELHFSLLVAKNIQFPLNAKFLAKEKEFLGLLEKDA